MRLILLFLVLIPNILLAQDVDHAHHKHFGFIENGGQWNDNVLFKTHFNGGNLWIEQNRLLFHLQDFTQLEKAHLQPGSVENTDYEQDLIILNFKNSQETQTVEKKFESYENFNFFMGKDESKWASNVKGYQEFEQEGLYEGINLRFIENEKELKYEFHVQPNHNPNQILLEYVNQQKLKIDKDGNLVISTSLGKIIEQKPYAYQIKNGRIREVDCEFSLEKNNVSFELGEYDKNIELIIDPVLVFATYCGSVTDNFGMTATYGYDGTAYSAGTVYGNAYPTPDGSAYDITSNFTVANIPSPVTTDVFISKYSEDGTTMLWTTFLGGGDDNVGTETPHSLICDPQNNIYVYGVTSSIDFPIVNGFQSLHGGGSPLTVQFNGSDFGTTGTDIYVAKVSANGQNLLGSTYIGGSENDGVNYKISSGTYNNVAAYDSLTTNYGDQFRGEIMLDSINNIIIASCSRSTDFPTLNPFQATNAGKQDGVIFKLNNDFASLQWSSYYGGTENDACYSVKIDSSANVVFAGGTCSNDLPNTVGGYQATYQGGKTDGFVGKLSSDGLSVTQATYVGMNLYDQVFFVEIDRLDNIFVVGQSVGGNFPVSPGAYSNPGSSQFLAKFTPDLTTVIESTVFGSGSANFDISPSAFLVDICGNIYVSGWGANILQATPIGAMAVSPNAFQATAPNGFDFYLIVLERQMGSLLYGTYMGGPAAQEHVDGGTSRFDKNGVVYQSVCGGCGGNSDFPTTAGAWSDQNLASNCNNLVFKFDFELIPNAEFTIDDNIGCADFEVEFTNFSTESDAFVWDFGNGNLDSTTFEPIVNYTTPGVYDVYLYVTDSVCLITDTAEIQITVTPPLQLDNLANISLCDPANITLTANSFGTAEEFIWSTNINFTDTLNPTVQDSVADVFSTNNQTYYIQLSNPGCTLIDSVEVNFTSAALTIFGQDSLCAGEVVVINSASQDPGITFSNYVWAPDSILAGSNGNSSISVNPFTSQWLYLTADASNGCVITDSMYLTVSSIDPTSVIATASEYEVPFGTSVTLFAEPTGPYSYLWSPNFVDNPTSQNTTVNIEETTTFTVYVSDGICTRSSEVLIKMFEFKCEEPFIYVPNAFTPNGDGDNDVLYVRSTIIKEMTFRVFNRWGEMIFESTDLHTGWDGTWRGKLMDPDTYDFYVKGICVDDQEALIKGNISLMR